MGHNAPWRSERDGRGEDASRQKSTGNRQLSTVDLYGSWGCGTSAKGGLSPKVPSADKAQEREALGGMLDASRRALGQCTAR